jgi:uncharacterized membrane protein
MHWRALVRMISILCTGLAAGILLGHARGVSLAAPQLNSSSFVQLQQIIHVHFVPMMPILLAGSACASIMWAILLRDHWRGVEFWLVSVAAIAMVAALALTLVVNVPINEQLMAWSVQTPPANLRELWQPWQDAHSVRTVLAVAAFGSLALASSTFAPSGSRR